MRTRKEFRTFLVAVRKDYRAVRLDEVADLIVKHVRDVLRVGAAEALFFLDNYSHDDSLSLSHQADCGLVIGRKWVRKHITGPRHKLPSWEEVLEKTAELRRWAGRLETLPKIPWFRDFSTNALIQTQFLSNDADWEKPVYIEYDMDLDDAFSKLQLSSTNEVTDLPIPPELKEEFRQLFAKEVR